MQILHNCEAITRLIDKADVVTFDVFDTLLIRKFANPTDVFKLMSPLEEAFHAARVRAETQSREMCFLTNSHYEVNISQIYCNMPIRFSHLTPEMEILSELNCLEPRRPLVDLFQYAREKGKKVYALSDIYYSSEQIARILAEKGMQLDGVFTSADAKSGKYNGGLFKAFLERTGLDPAHVLHIGDNRESDYEKALDSGINAAHVPKNYELLYRDSAFNLSAIDALARRNSPFSNFLISRLARLREEGSLHSAGELFGEMYAGPLLFGFVLWLEAMAKRDRIDELLLMTRDGYTIHQVFARLFPERRTRIFHCSRRALIFPALRHDLSWLKLLISPNPEVSLRVVLTSIFIEKIDAVLSMLEKAGIDTERAATEEIVTSAIRCIQSFSGLLQDQISAEHAGCTNYCDSLRVGDANRAVVDVGWGLNSHKALEQLTGTRIKGYYVGAHATAYLHGGIKTFLFGQGGMEGWEDIFSNCVELLELPFISEEDQLVSIRQKLGAADVNFQFRPPSAHEQARRAIVPDIRRAVISFADDARPFMDVFKVDDVRECLQLLYENLVHRPTPTERFSLGEILHDREVNSAKHLNIGSYWRVYGGEPLYSPGLVRKFIHLARSSGLKAAVLKTVRYVLANLRAHRRAHAKAAGGWRYP